MIKKDVLGYSGRNTSIVYNLDERDNNTIISNYIQHDDFFVGHFLYAEKYICIMYDSCTSICKSKRPEIKRHVWRDGTCNNQGELGKMGEHQNQIYEHMPW